MRLSDFIARDMEAILAAWDVVARAQLPAAENLDSVTLRDHGEEILSAVIKDLRTPQSAKEQSQKSLGRAPRLLDAPETAAETHGLLRAQWGFDVKQLIAEYRALRASVLHLWAEACKPGSITPEDVTRFNEAIDQAITESVAYFSNKLNHDRKVLLGTLGHDMRNPLHVIQVSAGTLEKLNAGEKVSTISARIAKCTTHLKALLDDLVGFSQTNLGMGLGLPTAPTRVDLAQLFGEVLELLRAGYPDRQMELEVTGDTEGVWDPKRIQQLLGNLVLNALKYGSRTAPVRVLVIGKPAAIEFRVRNSGRRIDETLIPHIFDPLIRGTHEMEGSIEEMSLGLGLYIARQIARAHGGEIAVVSDDAETAFTVRLPRLSCNTARSEIARD